VTITAQLVAQSASAPMRRLGALAELDAAAANALELAVASSVTDRARSELQIEGQPIISPLLVVEGWAARARILPDGRRQFISFLLPGDLIGMCYQEHPLAVATVVAITPVRTCRAPSAEVSPALRRAYAVSRALDEAYLLAEIVRLGRMTALERIGDVLLELLERLTLVGLVGNATFEMPLTQEMLSDVLGLTPVHVNRMLQQARREGWIEWRGKRVTIRNPVALASMVGRVPTRVQAP